MQLHLVSHGFSTCYVFIYRVSRSVEDDVVNITLRSARSGVSAVVFVGGRL